MSTQTLISLNLQLLKYLLLYLDRKDLTYLQLTCRLFKTTIDEKLYQQAQAPALNYRFFGGKKPKENHIISLIHNHGDYISSHIQLQNGLLVTGAYNFVHGKSRIGIWKIETRKQLAELIIQGKKINVLLEVEANILAVGLHRSFEFYNLQNPQKPIQIATVVIPANNGTLLQLIRCSSKVLAFISQETLSGPAQLLLLHFNFQNTSIKLEFVATLLEPLRHKPSLFALDENTILIVTDLGLYVYDLTNKDKKTPVQSIKFESAQKERQAIKLNDNKILTTRTGAEFAIDIWDVTPQKIRLLRSVPLLSSTKFSRAAHIFQKRNNVILIIFVDSFQYVDWSLGNRILLVDLKKESSKELVKVIPIQFTGLVNSQFIEDGRYLLTPGGGTLVGTLDCIRFPLLKEDNLACRDSFKTQLESCTIS